MDEMQWLPVVPRHTSPRFWSGTCCCVLASVCLLPAGSGSLILYVLCACWGLGVLHVFRGQHILFASRFRCMGGGQNSPALHLTFALPAQDRQVGFCLPVNMHHKLGYKPGCMPCVPPHSLSFLCCNAATHTAAKASDSMTFRRAQHSSISGMDLLHDKCERIP